MQRLCLACCAPLGFKEAWRGLCSECFICIESSAVQYDAEKDVYYYFIYEGEAKQLLNLYKRKQNKELSRIYAYLLKRDFSKNIIIPIPCSPERKKKGQFDPVLEIIKQSKLSYYPIIKSHKRKTQKLLNAFERKQNLKGKFYLRGHKALLKKSVLSHSFILLDDVTTTGSTLKEASMLLENTIISLKEPLKDRDLPNTIQKVVFVKTY